MVRNKGFMKPAAAPLLIAAMILFPVGMLLLFAEYNSPEKPNKMTVSSEVKDQYRRYSPLHLMDGTWASWCEGAAGDGIGSKFTYTYDYDVTIKDVYVKNGFGLRKYFPLNNRVKKMRMTADGKSSVMFDLADKPDPQKFKLNNPVTGKRFVFEILDVYKGSKFNDTCIAELAFKPFVIADTEEMPKFKTFSFSLMSGGDSSGSAFMRVTLKSDGTVKDVQRMGAQCDSPCDGGAWTKNPDGSVIINYDYRSQTNCGSMTDTPVFEKGKGSLKLKRFAVDGIIDTDGNRGVDLTWE